MPEQSIDITSHELAALVTPVVSLASTDPYWPLLNAVRIESHAGYLTATATDRFRLGISRIKPDVAPKPGIDFTLGLVELRRIQTIFKASKFSNPELRLTASEGRLRVEQIGGFAGFIDASMTFTLVDGDFPDIAHIIKSHMESTTDPSARFAVNPHYLAAFKDAAKPGEPMIVRTADFGKPILVTIGDHFIGAIMTVRASDDEADADSDLRAWDDVLSEQKAPRTKTTEAAA